MTRAAPRAHGDLTGGTRRRTGRDAVVDDEQRSGRQQRHRSRPSRKRRTRRASSSRSRASTAARSEHAHVHLAGRARRRRRAHRLRRSRPWRAPAGRHTQLADQDHVEGHTDGGHDLVRTTTPPRGSPSTTKSCLGSPARCAPSRRPASDRSLNRTTPQLSRHFGPPMARRSARGRQVRSSQVRSRPAQRTLASKPSAPGYLGHPDRTIGEARCRAHPASPAPCD